jgi:hypothetical protein
MKENDKNLGDPLIPPPNFCIRVSRDIPRPSLAAKAG